jgi:adenine-specific DNA-methyltransferase
LNGFDKPAGGPRAGIGGSFPDHSIVLALKFGYAGPMNGSPAPEGPFENEGYLNGQIITCLGNKRNLLGFIGQGIRLVLSRLNKKHLTAFDVFSGSGIVARYLKAFSEKIIANDLEEYSQTINRCYLANRSQIKDEELLAYYHTILENLGEDQLEPGLIARLYAPRNPGGIEKEDRVFYTPRNAAYLDTARQLIETVPPGLRHFFLAPLLSEASIHANTSGVFKGFYKDSRTGAGKFGGTRGDSLGRILGPISLPFPVFSNFECAYEVLREDANRAVRGVEEVDLAYLDPPYNQHPYGSNYFMLNLMVDYHEPGNVSSVSGIPAGWNRSPYNRRAEALRTFRDLVEAVKAKYLLVSYNSEGLISPGEMTELLSRAGRLQIMETGYNAFRGSRNLRNRNLHVKEYLYLVEKH